jgi:hypothetical protein
MAVSLGGDTPTYRIVRFAASALPNHLPEMAKVELKQMAGKDWGEFPRITTGPGTIEHAGETIVAEVCQAHACNDQGLLVVADLSKRTLYAAWKLRDRKIAVSPVIGDWPERAKVEIRRWAKAWTSP